MEQLTAALDALTPDQYPEAAREIVKRLTDRELLDHRLYCSDEEPKRRHREQDKAEAQAETIEAVWEAHPELKPKFETGPVEVTPTTKDGRITLAALLKAYPPFKQPTGAHDALPPGAQVSDEGRIWRNDLDKLNVWKPGTPNAGWTDITDMLLAEHNPPEPEVDTGAPEGDGQGTEPETEEPAAPPYKQPSGAHDAYNTGDRMTYTGETYESNIDGNVWSPDAYPQGWRLL